mmetsp:Transcript_52106/g.151409  ORF Transcript_52106/g.151409 Transcript_52106/m.151409 type:complete len:217 (+) Transcript_52106:335-985(+)
MVHGVSGKKPATELRDLVVLVVIDGVGTDFVHGKVQPAEQEVVRHHPARDLAEQLPGRDRPHGRSRRHLDKVEQLYPRQVPHELQVGTKSVGQHAVMFPEHRHCACQPGADRVREADDQRRGAAKGLANQEEGGPDKDTMKQYNVRWLGVADEPVHPEACKPWQRIREAEEYDPSKEAEGRDIRFRHRAPEEVEPPDSLPHSYDPLVQVAHASSMS